MKKLFTNLLLGIVLSATSSAQNVGIGTNTPTGPLSFASQLGNKIVLWGDGNAAHYGLGIQGSTLQLYADAFNSNISFGYGRSGAFTERARIYNSGIEGMYLNGRLHLRNGDPSNLGGGGGIWLYNPGNTAQIGFMGTQNSQNIGFYGGSAGWGFTYNTINSRVGIGNDNPNAPLAFAATLGKKITLYPGATGDAGFGVAGNRLQLYSDNPNADVAIGYDAAGTFNERFAVKPTGALAVVGNTGLANQVLGSAGPTAAAQWRSLNSLIPTPSAGATATLPAAGTSVFFNNAQLNFTLARSARVLIWIDLITAQGCVFYPCSSYWKLFMYLNGNAIWSREIPASHIDQTYYSDARSLGPIVLNLAAGSHSIAFSGFSIRGEPGVTLYPTAMILSD
ncbi:hypothetical protein [Phnomibacter ginsenosidimutans]|uniref:Uncharacterized protein n=1 Tax=Phnomibacter ginsenosidimutans TaxID=2676868 RepID=A0A6I6GAK0_9BACT|nr:hypothetical protein [Phnomibacter ginsenosidimutans]QGW29667.1 hypothetical protein GLV81_17465 [Phnomibacter ginsenosidimutans]